MNPKHLSIGALLFTILMVAGCYTQLGYYEPSRPVHREASEPPEEITQPESETEAAPETESEEEEGYYGRRKPGEYDYAPYYDDGYYVPYAPYPYYYPAYPYFGYHSPYYPYGYHYPRRYYGGYYDYPRHSYHRGDLNFGTRRSEGYRGVDSHRSSSERPARSQMRGDSKPPPAASPSKSSGSRFQRLRRSERRH
jgi:hypothetical protein